MVRSREDALTLNGPSYGPSASDTPAASILVVEDDPQFADLLQRILMPQFGELVVATAQTLAEALEYLRRQLFSLIFMDLNLPDSRGLATLDAVRAEADHAQILVMTGEADEELALQAMRRGAHDYLVKGRLSSEALRRVARYGVERHLAAMELMRSRLLLQAGLDALAHALAVLDPSGRILLVNATWEQQEEGNPLVCCARKGMSYTEALAALDGGHGVAAVQLRKCIDEALAGVRDQHTLDYRLEFSGRESYFSASVVRFFSQGCLHVVVSHVDITERKRMEMRLRQAQKLEAIGQLAAGIAHEINTPTQYIGDNIAFLRDGLKDLLPLLGELPADPEFGRIESGWRARWEALDFPYLAEEFPQAVRQSLEGVQRVTRIVSAMKDFSHPGGAAKERVDLNRAIESTLTVSRNAWKYVAELETDFDPDLPLVACFPGEFNQVILNLVVNAAHAIEEAQAARGLTGLGRIRVQTRREADDVEVRIEDSGNGIPEGAQSRIFEPFFTTKAVGRGTGQGLFIARSVVVEKHGGSLAFETRPGQGTTFIIRMPLGAET